MTEKLNKAAMSIGQKMYGGAKDEGGAEGDGEGEAKKPDADEAEFEKKEDKKEKK